MVTRAIAAIVIALVTVVIGVLILMFGWGLHPQSWSIIIWGTIVNMFLIGTAQALIKS
jgi:hypothetical protein